MQPMSAYITHDELHRYILSALNAIACYPATRIEADEPAMRTLYSVTDRLRDLLMRFEAEDEAAKPYYED